jgi:hypothetical protein
MVIKQTLELIRVILNHNYFQYKDKYFKPTKGIAMGSPKSSTLAEIYLQFFEELTIRQWMENGEIYYRRYGDEVTILFDQNKINKELISNYMNNIHKCLEFRLTEEENNNITYLDLSSNRNNNNLHLGIHRKPTQIYTTIHFISNHPLEHKLTAYSFYINRRRELAIREQAKQQ